MEDELAIVVVFRARAAILRRKLTIAKGILECKRLIHLAEEYEWRAACLESSIAVRNGSLATPQNKDETT